MFVVKEKLSGSLSTFVSVCVVVTGLSLPLKAEDVNSVTRKFLDSENSVEKSTILLSLKKYRRSKPAWVRGLLREAIGDKSPVVVAGAVQQIGDLGLREFNADLIELYRVAEKRFKYPGYTERVQCAIITALGKIGNSEARTFLADLLNNDKGSFKGGLLLAAIEELNDPAFIKDLKKYKAKIKQSIRDAREAGVDPFLYSDKTSYVRQAEEIESALSRGDGK